MRTGSSSLNFFQGVFTRYTFGNHVLRLHSHVAVKLNFRLYIRRHTSPNENFEYSYPLSIFLAHLGFKNYYSSFKMTADPGVASLISAESHTFVMIDHEIIFMAILLHSPDSRSYKRKYVQEVLVNRLVKLAQEKSIIR